MEMTAKTKMSGASAVTTVIDGYTITTEPPVAAGGSGEFPPATRLVVAALLNCIFTGFKSFCQTRNIPIDELEMDFSGDMEEGVYQSMSLRLHLPKAFPEEYKGALQKVLETCAVKKIASHLPQIQLNLS